MLLSWSPSAIGIVSGLLLWIGYLALPTTQERVLVKLPTPASTLPVLRNTLDVLVKHRTRIHDWLWEQCRIHKGKPWRIRVLWRPSVVVLYSPDALEDVLKTHYEHFVKGPVILDLMYDVLGAGIFVVDGPRWMHQRKTSSHLFTLQNIREYMESVVRERSSILCDRLNKSAANGETVNFKRILDLFTMDVFTKIGFGVDLNGLQTNANLAFMDAFDRALVNAAKRMQQPQFLWKLKRYFNIREQAQLTSDMKLINGFVFKVIDRSMQEYNKPEEERELTAGRKTLISLFLEKAKMEYANGANGVTDPQMIRDMSLNFMAAGRDTTSGTMSWFIVMMDRYPHVLTKIRLEIAANLPDLASGKKISPTMEETNQLPYLEAAIRETLRLYPVASITMRTATKDIVLSNGTLLPAGTRVLIPHYAMGRMEHVWGTDADQYNPDRWLDPITGKLLQISPFKFSVFLAGPRMCLGMNFALMELKIALATVVSKFDIKTVKDPFAFTYRMSLTLSIDGPLDVTITPIPSHDNSRSS